MGIPADGLDVWYSSRRGFALGVLGLPDDKGRLSACSGVWHYAGKRLDFSIDQPATVTLVMETPGWAALTGAVAMVAGLALIGVSTTLLAIALACTAVVFIGHSAMSRWVLIEQPESDGSRRKAYLTPAGLGRYTSAPRALFETLREDVPPPNRAM